MIPDKLVVAHLDSVESAVASLPQSGQFAFAAARISRQRGPFVRASSARGFSGTFVQVFDTLVEQLWTASTGNLAVLDSAAVLCGELVPKDFEPTDGPGAVLFTIENAIQDFIAAAQEGNRSYAHFHGCGLLDAGDHTKAPPAAPAGLDVEGEHPLEALEAAPAVSLGARAPPQAPLF